MTRLDWTQLVVKQSNVRETCMGNSTITELHFDCIFFFKFKMYKGLLLTTKNNLIQRLRKRLFNCIVENSLNQAAAREIYSISGFTGKNSKSKWSHVPYIVGGDHTIILLFYTSNSSGTKWPCVRVQAYQKFMKGITSQSNTEHM